MDFAEPRAMAEPAGWTAQSGERAVGERCPRCGMGFRAAPVAASGEPRHTDGEPEPRGDAGGVEILRCPDCGRRFWADPDGSGGRCAVGLVAEVRP